MKSLKSKIIDLVESPKRLPAWARPASSSRAEYDQIYEKTIEELMELATVMQQQKNRRKDLTPQIEEEIADVYCWLDQLKPRYNEQRIAGRILEKRWKYASEL